MRKQWVRIWIRQSDFKSWVSHAYCIILLDDCIAYGKQNNGLPKVHVLLHWTCAYVRLHYKGELRLLVELNFLISWPRDVKITLDYPVGPSVIIAMTKAEVRTMGWEKDSASHYWLWRWREGPWGKEWGQLLDTGKVEKTDSFLQFPERNASLILAQGNPILDFWAPELKYSKFVLFKATKFVAICYYRDIYGVCIDFHII